MTMILMRIAEELHPWQKQKIAGLWPKSKWPLLSPMQPEGWLQDLTIASVLAARDAGDWRRRDVNDQ